jgi:hypothetical protein
MLFLQAGDFKHPVVGKGRLEGGWQGRWGEVLDFSGKVIGIGQVCMVLSQHSSNFSIFIVSVLLDIPAFQGL